MKKLFILCLLLCIHLIAFGQDQVIFSDRPSMTDAVPVISPGTLQIELGYFNTKVDNPAIVPYSYSTVPNIAVKYGLLDWLELRVLTGIGISKDRFTSDMIGVTPIVFSPKFSLFKQSEISPGVSITSDITFPDMGKYPFRINEMAYGIRLLADYKFNRFNWTNSVRIGWHDSTDQQWLLTSMGSYSITKKLGVFLEFFGEENLNADGGFTYLILNNLQVDIIYGSNLNGDSYESFGFGLAWNTNFKNQ